MIYTLENEIAIIQIDTHACEIASFKRKDKDIEYMWNGDPKYWANRNPILFPHVSAPSNKVLNFKGKVPFHFVKEYSVIFAVTGNL